MATVYLARDVLTPQPVLTDGGGNASASWALPEGSGTFTLNVSVPDADNQPLETSDPPTGNVASTPDVAFDPQSLTFTAEVLAPEVTITFAAPSAISFVCEGDPSVCSETFTQDGYIVRSFWYENEPLASLGAHFHPSVTENVFEQHHWQGEQARQGVRIRRSDGQTFTLKSIDYRSRAGAFSPGTPFEIGTTPITAISGSPTLTSGYTPFEAPESAVFQTVLFSGFANKSEVWITMRGSADWANIVVTRP